MNPFTQTDHITRTTARKSRRSQADVRSAHRDFLLFKGTRGEVPFGRSTCDVDPEVVVRVARRALELTHVHLRTVNADLRTGTFSLGCALKRTRDVVSHLKYYLDMQALFLTLAKSRVEDANSDELEWVERHWAEQEEAKAQVEG